MKRSNHCLRVALLIVLMTADGALYAQSVIQPTEAASRPVREVLTKFIDAINSKDLGQIRSYVEHSFEVDQTDQDSWPTHCCAVNEVAQTLFNVARRSGGLTQDSTIPHGSGITAFLTTRSKSKRLYIDLECDSKEPYLIKSYQLVVMSPPPEEFLPRVKTDLSLATRQAMAKRALDDAAARHLFSGTVLIADHGEIILRGAYGEADNTRHIPNNLNTPFFVASLGKLFTGVAVAQLVSQGKLNYDEPISRYLPDYPNKAVSARITLRELLTHTSGLADIFSRPKPPNPIRSLSDYYPLFANEPLLFEPGKGQSYSNTGFLVASMIVEAVSGEDFRTYLDRHIFQPAGMRSTVFDAPGEHAIRYSRDNEDDPLNSDAPWISAEPFYEKLLGGPAAGPGGEYSTAEDLLRFATALKAGKLLDRKSLDILIQQGLGCQCESRPGQWILAHTGGGPGVDSGLKLYVDRDAIAIFLSNYSPPFPQRLMEDIGNFLIAQHKPR
ncbi:MAG TPA: serine hydrolase domain-containing protein [Candidatus Sulfotelmatobacter sp.]|nr:serine hydrolase domain-containing protein [Candidatus Sulfotelmatobacter sp.]